MLYTVYVNILPREEILDPQGKATNRALGHLGYGAIQDVRVGKRIRLQVEAASEQAAHDMAGKAAEQLLANKLTEHYTLEMDHTELA